MNAPFDITGVVLETERLLLRPWNEGDLDDFYEYASVPGVGEKAGWLPHQNKEESLRILRHFIEGKHTFAIVLKENGKTIGSLGVEEYGLEDKLSEFFPYQGRSLGYVLAKPYWGRGLMTEAVKRVIAYLFENLGFDFLLCGHFDTNPASGRVQEKCGFRPYRKLNFETKLGHDCPGVLTLLLNPRKKVVLEFSHPETLIYKTRPETIVTPRLILKAIEDADEEALLAIASDPNVTKTYMIPDFESKEKAHAFFLRLQAASKDPNRFIYGVFLEGTLIGFLNEVERDGGAIEIGYFIAREQWGKGYATEAFSSAIQELFNLGFSEVRAAHFECNPASGRVMQKCGLVLMDKEETIAYRGMDHRCVYYHISNR